jgi:nucleotide-binding universal stress UspA family protein
VDCPAISHRFGNISNGSPPAGRPAQPNLLETPRERSAFGCVSINPPVTRANLAANVGQPLSCWNTRDESQKTVRGSEGGHVMLRSILVPLDGSELAERALAYATALSIPTGARLILVRAVRAHTLPGTDQRSAQADAVRAAEEYLFDVAVGLIGRGFQCECATPYGNAAKWIVEDAGLRHADLIVMTTHGRTGPGRWLLGSVAESVVANASVPVLVERAWRPIRREPLLMEQPRLLVPLDGSAFAEAALEPAAALAIDLGARLVLLRVESKPVDVLKDSTGRVLAYVDQLLEQASSVATDYLQGLAERVANQWPGVTVQTEVVFGEPSAAIAEAARDPGAALIVMATHGRTGAPRAVMGSVAGRVLEQGNVPLVLVRAESRGSPAESRRLGGQAMAGARPLSRR